MTVQHLLVPLDLSEYAGHAFEYALTFAQSHQTVSGAVQYRLTLLHVIEPPPLPEMQQSRVAAIVQQLEAARHRTLEADYAARVREAGLECDTAILAGAPAQVIVDVARTRQIDLIIMGTHGYSGVPHMLLGHVAEQVLRLAPCPVLVVRPPEAVVVND
jgi:nucleotide-binding universal stress UspA family protein